MDQRKPPPDLTIFDRETTLGLEEMSRTQGASVEVLLALARRQYPGEPVEKAAWLLVLDYYQRGIAGDLPVADADYGQGLADGGGEDGNAVSTPLEAGLEAVRRLTDS